jgi:hypothetical protein
MNFCPDCDSRMVKTTSAATESIVFYCRCSLKVDGTPDDTLMAEGNIGTSEDGDLKHKIFIEQSPYDLAAHHVLKDCPQCGLNFMTMISIGVKEITMYSCSCGFQATHDEYMSTINAKK